MADSAPFKVFDFSLSAEEANNVALVFERIIAHVRPEWPEDKVTLKKLAGGMVNHLTCCHLEEDVDLRDAVVVRIHYNTENEAFAFDRPAEFLSLQLAIHAGVFTPIIATFKNGIVYDYAPGRTLVGYDLHNPKIIRCVSRSLAQLHSVDLDTPLWDATGQPATYPKQSNSYFPRFCPIYKHIPDQIKDKEANIWYQEMKRPPFWHAELAALQKLAAEIELPEGLIHLDLHCKNIVYDEEKEHVHFIDFEFTCIGPCAFDFGGCYNDRWFRDIVAGCRDEDEPDMTQETIDLWHLEYLRRRYELRGADPKQVTKRDIDKIQLESEICRLWGYLHWGIWGCLLLEGMLGTNMPMLEIMTAGQDLYDEEKSRLPERKRRYLQLLASKPE